MFDFQTVVKRGLNLESLELVLIPSLQFHQWNPGPDI